MKKKHEHIIQSVRPGSIAEELGIEPGDILLEIDGQVIEDIFDYQFCVESEELLVVIRKANGEEWELEIEKDVDEDLGIDFGKGLMDEYHSCHNKCIFCFIDQMPPGMRDTLYFKDDDSRLSFLQGNYVTLTNMSEKDMNRIVRYRLEPINISFQTTNPELRCKMLHNRFAGDALKKVDILYQGGIEMNGQIVLCRGVNDGEELERSIRDLTQYLPLLRSVSVVPVGLSKYRDGLYPLEPFTKEEAKEGRRKSTPNTEFISFMQEMSGIFWRRKKFRKRNVMTDIFSWRMESGCFVSCLMSLRKVMRSWKMVYIRKRSRLQQLSLHTHILSEWRRKWKRSTRVLKFIRIAFGMISSESVSQFPD